MKHYLLAVLIICSFSSFAQNRIEFLTKDQVEQDLAFLEEVLRDKSSYQGLNGYDYTKDFNRFFKNIDQDSITKYDFGVFLSGTIGKIGDRHAYIKDFEPRDSLYFPLAFAPYKDKIVVVFYDKTKKEYDFRNSEYPYLKSINNIPIAEILPKILPGEVLAPKSSYFTLAIRELRDIEKIFRSLGMVLPNPLPLVLSNEKGVENEMKIELVVGKKRARLWDERFYRNIFLIEEEQYNDKSFIDRFFRIQDNIGYIQLADMIEKEGNPNFFGYLNDFMSKAKESDALIIDVRDNGGGTRDLIQELAGYFIHPDSVYVANLTRQRGKLPLNEELKESLHGRFLYSRQELDNREQDAVDRFMPSFKPVYDLNNEKFSEYYFYVLNGQKLTKNKYHYDKPVYILANERSFSAASVLVSVFKDLPNIKIVGVNTDGSSGNSERFELPNSQLRGKISTMVSFQKNGEILDGTGTSPDITIERNLNQIFGKEDYQLNKLIETIQSY